MYNLPVVVNVSGTRDKNNTRGKMFDRHPIKKLSLKTEGVFSVAIILFSYHKKIDSTQTVWSY